MSHNTNLNNPRSDLHPHRESHHYHASAGDDTWRSDEYGAHPSSHTNTDTAASRTLHGDTQRHHEDKILFTEKVTKTFDSEGNVISSRVEHPKPLDDLGTTGMGDSYGQPSSGIRGASGAAGGSDLGSTTGATHGNLTAADKVIGQGEKLSGSATSNPNKFFRGEAPTSSFK